MVCLVTQSYLTLCNPIDSSVHGESPGRNTGVDCHALLQGIFPTQGSNPGLLHCRWILYQLSHQGSPKVYVKVAQLCPRPLWDLMDYTVHGILQARILEWVAIPFSSRSSQARSPALHVDSLLSETPGKPKNTGVGSLSLLQGIFPTQESNRGFLHCRQILYQLSYQGSLLGCLDKYKQFFLRKSVRVFPEKIKI